METSLYLYHLIFLCLHNIDENGETGGDQHDRRVHFKVLADDPLDGEEDQNGRYDPNHNDRDKGAQHLCSVPAEGELSRRFPTGHPQRQQRDHEASEIR